ncbi:hypothetical protein P3553_34370, partial [Vibrio parahaemolyticus]|nr:hypothetical protein [Vibrio parahaemolyticus]
FLHVKNFLYGMPAEKTIEVIQDITKPHLNWHSVAITMKFVPDNEHIYQPLVIIDLNIFFIYYIDF